MRNGIGFQQSNQDDHPKEGNHQSGSVCLHQGGFQQTIAADKLGAISVYASQRRLQKPRPNFPWFQLSSPLSNPSLLENSFSLFHTNEPLQRIRRLSFAGGEKSFKEKEGYSVALKEIHDLERFDPDRFVNREVELASVDKRVSAFRRGEVVKQPLINFWGVADIGKTWLLKEIERRYQFDSSKIDELHKPTCTLYFDFDQPDLTVTAVSQALLSAITNNLIHPALTDEKQKKIAQLQQTNEVDVIVNFIIDLAVDLVFILLLDTTEHVEDPLWEKLETKLFEPLLKSNKILLIVAGRNRAPRWKRVEVRRRATPIEKSQVQPFNQQTTEDQLNTFGLPANIAQTIFDDSAGTPGLITKLSHYQLHISEANYIEARTKEWNQYVKDIFDHLSELSEIFSQIVMAVLPLRYYRTQALRNMLEGPANYHGDTSDVFLLRTLRKLDKQSHLVWWDDQQNAYVTALAARKILNRRLQIEEPARFVKLHTFALEMYREWAREYETSLPAYIPELLFHEATIYKTKNLVPDSKIEPASYIKMIDEMSIDNRDILHRRLEKDTELQALLPELFNKIFSHLEESVGNGEG